MAEPQAPNLAPETALERKLYFDIVRTTVHCFELGLKAANGFDILGHDLRISVTQPQQQSGFSQDGLNAKLAKPVTLWTPMNEGRVQMDVLRRDSKGWKN